MRHKTRLKAGPLVGLAVVMMGVGFAVTAYVAQLEPEVELRTNLPLARI